MRLREIVALALLLFALTAPASAQEPTLARDGMIGYAGFVDDATIHHTAVGGAMRWYVTRRLSVGPELVYMIGPGEDRDLMVTGNVTFDILAPREDGPRAVTPFLAGGAGLFQHRDRFFGETFSSVEGSFTLGGGVRAMLGSRFYIAPEFRLGWELHYRVNMIVGWLTKR